MITIIGNCVLVINDWLEHNDKMATKTIELKKQEIINKLGSGLLEGDLRKW